MVTFESLLQEFEETLRKYNPLEYEKLQPPLRDKEIEESLVELGISDENIKGLFQWKNGEKEDSYCQMMIFGGLQSLEVIKKFRSDIVYDSRLVEIISDNGEESLLFNTNAGTHYGKLYLYSVPSLHIQYPISCFDSLEAMLKTVIEAYKKEAFLYDKQRNFLNINYDRFVLIAREYNKNSKYWTGYNLVKKEEWYEI